MTLNLSLSNPYVKSCKLSVFLKLSCCCTAPFECSIKSCSEITTNWCTLLCFFLSGHVKFWTGFQISSDRRRLPTSRSFVSKYFSFQCIQSSIDDGLGCCKVLHPWFMQSLFCPTDELQSHGICCRTEFIRSPLPGWFTGETRSSAGKNTHPSKKKVTTRNRLDVTSGSVRAGIRGIYSTSYSLQSIYTKHKNEAFISWQKFLILQALTWAWFLHKISRKKFGLLAGFLSIVKFSFFSVIL